MTNDTLGLTTVEAARELRIHPNTLMRWVRAGKIPYIRLGGRKVIFSRKEIERLLTGLPPNIPPSAPA